MESFTKIDIHYKSFKNRIPFFHYPSVSVNQTLTCDDDMQKCPVNLWECQRMNTNSYSLSVL